MANLRGRSDWSPDGGSIATYAGESWAREIYIMNPDGSDLRQITQGGNNLAPSFSPDGGWITFTSYMDNFRDDHGCEIYIMRVDGTDIRRLTTNNYCDWQPRWGR
jgi:TolB protein